jgi:hypothetical protein
MFDTSNKTKMRYICPRCDYKTSIISNYTAHLNRKTACKDINESNLSSKTIIENLLEERNDKKFECDTCNTKFTTNGSLKRHLRTCDGTKRSNNILENGLKTVINNITNNNTNNTNCNNTINTNCNNTTYNNNTVNVICFGQENLDYIINDKKFLDSCFRSFKNGIPAIIERINFNSEKPENNNVYIKRERYPGICTAFCKDLNNPEPTWKNQSLDLYLDKLISRGIQILNAYNQEKKKALPNNDELIERLDILTAFSMKLNNLLKTKDGTFGKIKSQTLEIMKQFTESKLVDNKDFFKQLQDVQLT